MTNGRRPWRKPMPYSALALALGESGWCCDQCAAVRAYVMAAIRDLQATTM